MVSRVGTIGGQEDVSLISRSLLTAKDDVNDKILAYNRANRAVAILCNHQRAVPKTFAKSMENMQKKLQDKKDQIHEAEVELKKAKTDYKNLKTVTAKKYSHFRFQLKLRAININVFRIIKNLPFLRSSH